MAKIIIKGGKMLEHDPIEEEMMKEIVDKKGKDKMDSECDDEGCEPMEMPDGEEVEPGKGDVQITITIKKGMWDKLADEKNMKKDVAE